MDGLPLMTNEQLLIMFEVPEKDYPKYHFSNNEKFTNQLDRNDCISAESIVEPLAMKLYYCGYSLIPLKTEVGLVCIEEKYLKPLADLEQGYELYLRYSDRNKPYIVAKAGMFLKAVILPCEVVDKFFYSAVKDVMKLTEAAIGNGAEEGTESFLHGK